VTKEQKGHNVTKEQKGHNVTKETKRTQCDQRI